ncbi:YcjX family protein, partial [Vibrio sp. 2175-1]
WQNSGIDFTSFRPMQSARDEPMKHIRLDKALDYLLGDKLK